MSRTYRPMDVLEIPKAIPAIGMESGTPGVIEAVDEGEASGARRLLVDASGAIGIAALVDVEVGDDGTERVVGYVELT